MFKSTIQVTLFSIFGIIINFIIQLLLAYFFGTSNDRDAYFVALTIPSYIAVLFTGSIGMLLVPHLVKYSTTGEKHDTTFTLTNFLIITLLVIALLGYVFAEPVLKIIVPADKSELFHSAIYLFRILMFSMIFTVLNNLLLAEFQSRNIFLIPSISTIITSITSLLAVALLSPLIGISSIAFGALMGGFLTFLYLLFKLKKKIRLQWTRQFISYDLRILISASLPLLASSLIFRSTILFERYFASRLPEGALSYLGNGNQIVMILSTIVSTGIATTSFPLMSRYWSENNMQELKKTFTKVLNIIMMVVFPMIIMFIFFGKFSIRLLFEHGAFTPVDTIALYNTLLGLMGYFLFGSLGNVVARILYIANHTRVAGIIGILELVVYITGAAILSKSFGYMGLAISMSLGAAFNVIISLVYIRRNIITGIFTKNKNLADDRRNQR